MQKFDVYYTFYNESPFEFLKTYEARGAHLALDMAKKEFPDLVSIVYEWRVLKH